MYILSVCIPTYNRAEALDTCLFALCTQIVWDKLPIKIIISDNASTDHTVKIAQKWTQLYDFVEYHRNKENIGGIKNFWKVTEYVQTEHFWFMGDDALVLPGSIKHVCDILTKNDDVSWLILAGTNNPKDQSNYIQEQIIQQGEVVRSIDKNKFVCSFWLQTLGSISRLVINSKKWRKTSYCEHEPYEIYPQIKSLLEISVENGNLYYSNRLCVISYRANQSHNDWYLNKASISIALEFPCLQDFAKRLGFSLFYNEGLFKNYFSWKFQQWIRMLIAHPLYKPLYSKVLNFETNTLRRFILYLGFTVIPIRKPLKVFFERRGYVFPTNKEDIFL